jgi:ABC-type transporter Mla subunit MlaD
MECVYKERIKETVSSVRSFSFDEKNSPLNSEERINTFLDSINEFKDILKDKTQKINKINTRLQEITWFNNLDDDCLRLLNDIISAGKDLHSSLVRQYAKMGNLRKKGIAKEEIRFLKLAIDDLKEAIEDLDSVFFYLPNSPNFIETTRLLSLS